MIQVNSHLNNRSLQDVPSYSSSSERSATACDSSSKTALFLQKPSKASSRHNLDTYNNIHCETYLSSEKNGDLDNGSHNRVESGLVSATAERVDDVSRFPIDYSQNDSSLEVPVSTYSDKEQLLTNTDLPPYDLLYTLVDLYFENVNTWCPILDRRSTLDTMFGPSPLEEEDRILLYAIIATTLRFSADPRLTDENRKHYHATAKQKVLLYGLDSSSVKALQALVILALDLVGCSNGPPGWKLLALISRSIVQLGLAGEMTSTITTTQFPSIYTIRANVLPDSKSWIEDESRRRLFWAVYLLDRYSTIATAFDFALNDKDIHRKLPCKDEFFVKDQPVETKFFDPQERSDYHVQRDNVGSFGLYMEIIGILSRIHLFLKRPVDIGAIADVEEWQSTYKRLDNELTTWLYNLPKEYTYDRLTCMPKSPRAVQYGWVMLHATYQT